MAKIHLSSLFFYGLFFLLILHLMIETRGKRGFKIEMLRSKTIRTKKVYIKKEDFKDEIKPSQKLKVIN